MKKNLFILLFVFMELFAGCKEDIPSQLTPEEIEQQQLEAIIKLHEIIEPIANEALLSDNPEEEFKKVVEQFKDNPEIETIEFEDDNLALKYKNGGWVFWLIREEEVVDDFTLNSSLRQIVNTESSKYVTTRSTQVKAYPKLLLIYQNSNDLTKSFQGVYEEVKKDISKLKSENIDVTTVYGEAFNRDFAKSYFKGYDAIIIFTHGLFYEKTGDAWLITGEKTKKGFSIIGLIGKEWISGKKIAFCNVKEKHKNSKGKIITEDVEYYGISQHFINENYSRGDFPSNSFLYLGACHVMQDPLSRFAKVFYDKGIGKISGYDNKALNWSAYINMKEILTDLLKGLSYDESYTSFIDFVRWRETSEGWFKLLEKDLYPAKRQDFYNFGETSVAYSTNLVSYPADTDFRFHFLKLAEENVSLPLAVGHVKEIAILSGSNNYEVVSSDDKVATASVTSEKVTITALAEGQARITVTDKDTQLTSMLDVVVRTKQKHKIEEIIPETYLEVLGDLEFPIYDGENPPIINGTYDISPLILKATNKTSDFPIGHRFADAVLRFYNQNNETFEIQVKEKYDTQETSSIQTAITSGDGSNFTVYGTVKAVEIDNPSVYIVTASVYSGTLNSDGSIKDFAMSFICVDKNDPEGKYINKGDARVVIDGDYHSPKTTWTSTRSWSVDALPTITAKRE